MNEDIDVDSDDYPTERPPADFHRAPVAHELRTSGKISTNDVGGEIIKFKLWLGPLTLVFIVNVPEEGRDRAPVYVKFIFNDPKGNER